MRVNSDEEVVVSLCHADDRPMMVPITICKQGQINATDADLPSFSQLSDTAKQQKIERERAGCVDFWQSQHCNRGPVKPHHIA